MSNKLVDFVNNHSSLNKIVDLALSKKAIELNVLDVRGLSSIADYFVICSGNSEPQVKAISDHIRKGTSKKPHHIEGYENQKWILLDYFDIIVHIFKSEQREYYNLERLWADAPINKYHNEKSKIPITQ
jgi:ribosome-associated protein